MKQKNELLGGKKLILDIYKINLIRLNLEII